MANDYVAKAIIETAESTKGLTSLGQAATSAGTAFAALDKQLKGSNTSLKDAAAALKSVVESTRQGAIAAKALADAELQQAKASGQAARNADAHALSEARRTKELELGRAASERRSLATQNDARAAQRATEATERHGIAVQRNTERQERSAAASARAAAASLEVTDHLSNSRYLLYDVASTYQMVATAMLAIPAAATAVAIAYERDMAQVVRTNDQIWGSTEAIGAMKDGLKELATEIPTSFSELANIASIGGQLGIASSEMLKFTETVAKFGAASNVTTEQAATAFGRLQNAFPDDAKAADFFNKIGSSIAYVGVKSVATETEIIAIANQLSALASQSGFTSSQVVGLSGALASVRIRPELARGAFLSTMTKMTSAAQEGATAFETYSKYLGMTGEAGKQLFETNPGEFFNQFIQGIGSAIDSGQAFSTVMSDLGVKEKRETQFLLALANGADVTAAAFKNAGQAYNEGTFLDESTARVFTTVSAELQKLANNFKNLGDTLGGGTMNLFAEFLRLISGAVKGISDLASQYSGVAVLINTFLGVGAVVGVLLAFKAAQAAALAAVVAFRQVVGSGITASISFSGVLKELAVTMNMARGATLAESQALVAQTGALRAVTGAALGTATATAATGTAAQGATTRIAAMAGAARGVGGAMLGLVGGPIGALITGLTLIGAGFFAAGTAATQAGKDIAEGLAAGAEQGTTAILEKLRTETSGFFNTMNSGNIWDWGDTAVQIADRAGVSLESMTNAIKAGENAGTEFGKTLDAIAQSKGFKSFEDWDMSGQLDSKTWSDLNNLKLIVEQLGTTSAEKKKDLDATSAAADRLGESAGGAKAPLGELEEGLGGTGEEADKAAKNITNFVDALFGLVNAEAASAASLEKLGAGLQESTSFNPNDSGGRDNLAALQETLRNAALLQQQLYDAGEQSASQAQANYVAFVDGLYAELGARGVDVEQIRGLADQTKSVFNAAVNDENANNSAALKVGVEVDPAAVEAARAYLAQITAEFGSVDVDFLAKIEGGEEVAANVEAMKGVIEQATGQPYTAVVNADTSNANENVTLTGNFVSDIVAAIYMMSVGADISPATAALQTLAQFAANVVNSVIDGINTVANALQSATGMPGRDPIGRVGWGQGAPAVAAPAAAPRVNVPVAAPKQVAPKAAGGSDPTKGIAQGLDNVAQGYDKAAKAADKAGGAGKDAGKDMADGIEEAQKSLDDYVSRLKSGLTQAYDRQYGMATATDNYYKALNAITDKRKEDLKSIEDLITAQKQLNNERNKDLVDANKAKIEKNISIKYGETDRAADYANQEQTALDNAAAKQKDIQANKDNQKSLVEGMNALTGYSNAAIANRAALRDVESKMLDMIVAYAATGASQQQVSAYAAALTAKFQQQVGQIGYTQSAVNNLQGSMGRYVATVNSVPRTVNTNVATQGAGAAAGALNGVAAAARGIPAYTRTVSETQVQITYLPVNDSFGALKGYREVKNGKTQMGVQLAYASGGQVPGFSSGGQVPGRAPSDLSKDNKLAKVDGKGLVGIQSEEWIIQKKAVDYYGNDFMDDLNNMRLPKFASGGVPAGYSGGGQSSGDMIVALDAATMSAFAQFMNQPTIMYADTEVLASTAFKGGEILATKGVRNK